MSRQEGIPIQVGSCFQSFEKCERDWDGEQVDPPVEFGFLLDNEVLRFCAQREAPAICHPESSPGEFREELWQYDVAEFFLSHPENGSYLEVNLAPNGAWWTCLFRAPRERWSEEPLMVESVNAEGELTKEAWSAEIRIPLASLRALPVGFEEGWGLNASFVIDSPQPRYLSALPLGLGPPDFHQPDQFLPCRLV